MQATSRQHLKPAPTWKNSKPGHKAPSIRVPNYVARPLWRRRWVLGFALLMLCTSFYLAYQHLPRLVVEWVQAPFADKLVLQDVLVTGQHNVNNQEVVKAMNLQIGTPLLSLDLEAIRARLMELAWVADVEVKRVFPETLQVAIHERHPAALWQHNGKLRLLDVDGHDFTPQDLRPFRDMMLLIGEDAPSHLLSLQKILATAPELQAHVKIAIRVGGRRWNLRFDNGMEVKLPEIEPEKAMAQLMNMHRKKSLWKSTIRSIDMRISGKIFIK